MRRQSVSETQYTNSMKKNESFTKWIGGIAGAGVLRAVSFLQVWQWGVAARAARMDVAMASTMEAPSIEVYGDDWARVWMWAIACMGTSFFLSLGFDDIVNGLFPKVRGVKTQCYLTRFSTFGNLVTSIGDHSH